jgi:hypothetical protein
VAATEEASTSKGSEAGFTAAESMQALETAASQTPETEQQPIAERLLLDFYLSFRFSQAVEETQTALFAALIKEYRRAGMEPTAEDLELVKSRLSGLKPPSNHTKVVSSRLGEFKKMWGKLEETFAGTTGEQLEPGELLELGRGMARSDVMYQTKSRPSREIGDDLHESFFRTYVLQGAATHSAAYDSLMQEVRQACEGVRGPAAKDFVELATAWEYTHRGQKFYPESETQAA